MTTQNSEDRPGVRMTDAEEIAHYDRTSSGEESLQVLRQKIADAVAQAKDGNLAMTAWLDTKFDSVAQQDVVEHLLPLPPNANVLQVGGTGLAALKSLVAGAASATLVTPSQGELDLTRAVAQEFGLSERLVTVRAFGEEMPLGDASFDVAISEASMHHTDLVPALAEVHRVLRPGGKFGCFEPWRAPFYSVGTRLLGKRDPGVACRPLDSHRAQGIAQAFPGVCVTWHGAIVRYPLIALAKLGVPVTRQWVHRLTRLDDAFTRFLPGFRRRFGSSVSLLATKSVQGI